jgi:hypothetical protein
MMVVMMTRRITEMTAPAQLFRNEDGGMTV